MSTLAMNFAVEANTIVVAISTIPPTPTLCAGNEHMQKCIRGTINTHSNHCHLFILADELHRAGFPGTVHNILELRRLRTEEGAGCAQWGGTT